MIFLHRSPKPEQLAKEEANLRDAYLADNSKRVWDKEYIKEALRTMSHNKCAYSEVQFAQHESKYLSVDHFLPKSLYGYLVVAWDNLLPVLPYYNSKKGDHDPKKEPIIDPSKDAPQSHLFMSGGRLFTRNGSTLGDNTRRLLDLNSKGELPGSPNLLRARRDMYDEVQEELESLEEALVRIKRDGSAVGDEGRYKKAFQKILLRGQPQAQYSAVAATLLLEKGSRFLPIKALMKGLGWWHVEFDALEANLHHCALCFEKSLP